MRHALLPFKQFPSAAVLPVSFFTSSRVYLHTSVGIHTADSTEEATQAGESTSVPSSNRPIRRDALSVDERVRLLQSNTKEPSKWLKYLQLPKTPSPAFDAIYNQLCRSPNNADTLLSFWKSHPTLFSTEQIDTLFAYFRERQVKVTNGRVFSILLPLVDHLPEISHQWTVDLATWLDMDLPKLSTVFDRLDQLKSSNPKAQMIEKVLHAEVDLLLDPSSSASLLYTRKLFSSYTAEGRPLPHAAVSLMQEVAGTILHSSKGKKPAEDLFTLSGMLNTAINQGELSTAEVSAIQQKRLRQSFSDTFALALVKAPQSTMSENHVDKQDAAYATADDYALSILRHAHSNSIPLGDYPALLQEVLSSGYRIKTACHLLQTLFARSTLPHTNFEPALNTICHFLMRRKQPARILHLLSLFDAPFSDRLVGRKLQALLSLKRKTDVQGYIRTLETIPVQGIIALIHSFRGDEKQVKKLYEYWLELSGEREDWVENALVEALRGDQVDPEEAVGVALGKECRREKKYALILRCLSLCLTQGLTELTTSFLLHPDFPKEYLTPRIVKRTVVSAAKHHPFSWEVMQSCLALCGKINAPAEVFNRNVTLHHTIRTILRADCRPQAGEEKVDIVLERLGKMLDLSEGHDWMERRIQQSLDTVLEGLDWGERDKRILRMAVQHRLERRNNVGEAAKDVL